MIVTCTHCNAPNKVAGLYFKPCRDGQKSEGTGNLEVYCGFCGKTFKPVEPPVEPSNRLGIVRKD